MLLVRLTALQRQLYERFMNEVVRVAAVPNPLKAFAICCKVQLDPGKMTNMLVRGSVRVRMMICRPKGLTAFHLRLYL